MAQWRAAADVSLGGQLLGSLGAGVVGGRHGECGRAMGTKRVVGGADEGNGLSERRRVDGSDKWAVECDLRGGGGLLELVWDHLHPRAARRVRVTGPKGDRLRVSRGAPPKASHLYSDRCWLYPSPSAVVHLIAPHTLLPPPFTFPLREDRSPPLPLQRSSMPAGDCAQSQLQPQHRRHLRRIMKDRIWRAARHGGAERRCGALHPSVPA